MKKAGTFMASVAAASTVALPPIAADRQVPVYPYCCSSAHEGSSSSSSSGDSEKESGSRRGTGKEEKFAPRFDGLRFIETLVTAHR